MGDGAQQRRQPSTARDPLHGVTLERLVTHLHDEYGWEELARRIPVKCFQTNPSISSSLKFLRKTPWAREQVEGEYLKLGRREDTNPLIGALKAGTLGAHQTVPSQTKAHEALGWALRHGEAEATLGTLLGLIQDVTFWQGTAPLPLLNLAIDRDAPPSFIRELLRRGADANDSRYWLPLLHTVDVEGLAYQSGRRAPRTDVLDLLLTHGATPTAADPRGHTALDMARTYGLKAVIHKLAPSTPS
ncbi:VF530 family DNA-binding protein [Deinococcus sp. HMF7604]|uniref:VF530 family DNA-binding protein n=1 Tax=Deinococcus betulae TaxID=2873312 RepID=UPI001CCCC7D7|nr:VF530 family DNA-binding protein [Deinococcus betulae]MBZ9752055.1 VF530 family DNA-binding protein [Deinococcus betulae]